MFRKQIIVGGIVCPVIFAICLFGAVQHFRMTIPDFIAGADRIELFFVPAPSPNRTDRPGVVLANAAEIADLVEGLVLTPGAGMTQCLHMYSMRIWKGEDVLIASLCEGCFGIIDRDRVVSRTKFTRFQMPEEFWTKFSQHAQEQK